MAHGDPRARLLAVKAHNDPDGVSTASPLPE
jgi:hypothetical protein